jgi:hypothetical protein
MSGKCYASNETCSDCGRTILVDSDTQNEVGGSHVCGGGGRREPLSIGDWVKLILFILIVGLISFSIYISIGEHRDQQRRMQGVMRRLITSRPEFLKTYVMRKEDDIETLMKYRENGFDESYLSYQWTKIEDADKVIEDFRNDAKKKMREGYLKPGHTYYEDYKEVFGKEDWWPDKYK